MNSPTETKARLYDLSVIVPFFNERESLVPLYEELVSVLEKTGKTFEMIFIDDGSSDGGQTLMEELARRDARVKLIEFTHNFGQTAAMAAGFKNASGRIYVTIDADRQNVPADIPRLLAKLDEGYDVVSGWRKSRKDSFISRRLPSIFANRILSTVTGLKLKDYGCSLKVYRAEFIDSVSLYGEMHRFIPAYAFMAGARVAEIEVGHRARTSGKSKYGLRRVIKVVIDLVTVKFSFSYSTKPGYLFGGVGLFMCLAGFASGVEVLVVKYTTGAYAHRNPFLLLAVFLFILGVQMILMGLIAELLVRTYHESQNKPIYVIKRILANDGT